MKYFSQPIDNLRIILKNLAPTVNFRLQMDNDGHGPYPTQNLDQMPTEAELLAAESDAVLAWHQNHLVYTDTLKTLLYANDTVNPLTGQVISASNDPEVLRQHMFSAESYWKMAYPTADQTTKDAIDAIYALQDTLRSVWATIKAEIEAAETLEDLPTDDEIINDPRWP